MSLQLDNSPISQAYTITSDGFLRIYGRIARVGELPYFDKNGNKYTQVVDPEVLFNPGSIATFWEKPITDGHPPVPVTSTNSRQHLRGFTTTSTIIEANRYLGLVQLITDEGLKRKILNGDSAELSAAYWSDKQQIRPGVLKQLNRRGNHIASVPRGRAGFDVRYPIFSADAADDSNSQQHDDQILCTNLDDIYNEPLFGDPLSLDSGIHVIEGAKVFDLTPKPGAKMPPQFSKRSEKSKDKVMKFTLDGVQFETDDQTLVATVSTVNQKLADAAKAQINLDAATGKSDALAAQITSLQSELDALKQQLNQDAAPAETIEDRKAWATCLPILEKLPGFEADSLDWTLNGTGIKRLTLQATEAKIPADKLNNDAYVQAFFDIHCATLAQPINTDSADSKTAKGSGSGSNVDAFLARIQAARNTESGKEFNADGGVDYAAEARKRIEANSKAN